MNFIKKITYLILGTLSIYIGSPLLYASSGIQSGEFLSIGSSIGNCTGLSFHCEKFEDLSYACEQKSTLSENHGLHFREIPGGNSSQGGITTAKCIDREILSAPRKIGSHYREPNPYLYPFVSIIKIQI